MSKRAGVTLTKAEIEYIRNNYESMGPEEIAKNLDRSLGAVNFYINKIKAKADPKVIFTNDAPKPLKEVGPAQTETSIDVVVDLKDRPEYKTLRAQFDEDEISYFEARYNEISQQFSKEGILSTENVQIFQLIKYEILMDRNLKERKQSEKEIEKLNEILAEEEVKDDDSQNHKMYITQLLQQISARISAQSSRTSEYVKLQEKHKEITRELKATRDQRIKNVESIKVDFVSVLKGLNDPLIRDKMGREAELSVLAASKELARLSNSHKYNDGNWDQPILNADTIADEAP